MLFAGRRPLRIHRGRLLIVGLAIPIVHPFPYVSRHIVQLKSVAGSETSNRSRVFKLVSPALADKVRLVPAIFVIAKGKHLAGCFVAGCILPLSLGWQSAACPSAKRLRL